jgi:hypothetical protein
MNVNTKSFRYKVTYIHVLFFTKSRILYCRFPLFQNYELEGNEKNFLYFCPPLGRDLITNVVSYIYVDRF